MKNNKKTIMIVSIIIGVLVLTIGLTYSIFTISKTGSNSKLVVGDVYMHYKETTNSINLTNQMPLAEKYIVNPNMANQTYQEDTRNELSKCVDVVEGAPRFDEGSTAETYCKGTGTMSGETFQEAIDNGAAVSYFKELNIVTSDNKVNPDMANQTYQKDTRNELSKCMYLNEFETFDEGSTAETYCKGTGTIDGKTFQEDLEEGNITNEEYLSLLKEKNILTLNVTTLPYFEFTIDGKNTTTNKDIWYEIILKHGDNLTGKTRIKDNLLKFTLTETKDGVTSTIFSGETYKDLTSKRVYVNTINRNTTTDVNITYRLYMWISNDTMICAGDPKDNCDYYTDNTPNWNDVFASIKVDVAGDFNEKYVETDASCFNTNQIDNNGVTELEIASYDTSCGTDVVIPSEINGYKVTRIANCGSNPTSNNTKGVIGNLNYYTNKNYELKNASYQGQRCSFKEANLTSIVISHGITYIGSYAFDGNQLTSVEIADSVTEIGDFAFYGNQLKTVEIPDSVTEIGNYAFSNNQLTSVKLSNNLTTLRNDAFQDNQLTSVTIPGSLEVIEYNAFQDNQLTSVTIPGSLEVIEYNAFANNQLTSVKIEEGVKEIGSEAFENNKIISIEIPDSVIEIGAAAFNNNKLPDSQAYIYKRTDTNNDGIAEIDKTTVISYGGANKEITIPSNVTTIGEYAFQDNQLTSITIGNGIQYIGRGAFYKFSFSNPDLQTITINKSCSDIKNIQASSTDTTKYYPWLFYSSPYTAADVTIYGLNNEECDNYRR